MTIGTDDALRIIDRERLADFLLARKDTETGGVTNERWVDVVVLRLCLSRARVSINSDRATFALPQFRMHEDGEIDIRGSYTAFAVALILDMSHQPLSSRWQKAYPGCTTVFQALADDHALGFLQKCQVPMPILSILRLCSPLEVLPLLCLQTFEGGMASEPGGEAHGGYTFCGLAAMAIAAQVQQQMEDEDMGAANPNNSSSSSSSRRRRRRCPARIQGIDLLAMLRWVQELQGTVEGGFAGRANKLVDGCYSYWQGQ